MQTKNIVAIIQARGGSTRLENKIHLKLYAKTLLEHIIERVASVKLINKIIIASTTQPKDKIIQKISQENGCDYYLGSEHNVLDRFYNAALKSQADIIVRITSDDAFKDPEIITKAIELLIDKELDYCSNTMEPTYPEGIDVEVFTFNALHKAFKEATLSSEKEHVTPYIWKNKHLFKTYNFKYKTDISHLRWTIDYESDFLFAQLIYKKLYETKKIFLIQDILDLLQKEPTISDVLQDIVRNEGYLKSLTSDPKETK